MRRTAVLTWLAAGTVLLGQAAAPPFDVFEKTIPELAAAMAAGSVTSQALVDAYLARIEAYDHRGPAINAVITVNRGARAQAAALDRANMNDHLM